MFHTQELYSCQCWPFLVLLPIPTRKSDLHLDIGNGEKIDNFCYLGDMLDADGGCDSTVTARVRSAWKKFHEYLPILTGKGFLLNLKGKVYATCMRSCLMHGSETWLMKVEHELKMNLTEMK